MSRAGGKRDSEDPFNPFAPDAIDERNRRHSVRISSKQQLFSSQSIPKKRDLSSQSIPKKINPNAPQHSAWSRPAEGRKEISTAPTKTPKPKKAKKPIKGTTAKPKFIGNQEYFADSIVFEDSKPFMSTAGAKFFSVERENYQNPNCKGAMLTLTSDSIFMNESGTPLSHYEESEQREYVYQCLRRLTQHLPPQKYKVLSKNHSRIMVPAKNNYKTQITDEEKEGKDFSQTKFIPHGEHFNSINPAKKKVGTSEPLDIPKRTKSLKAAVIDTDGALLEELFKSQKFCLQYRKIITTNSVLQRFFENIHYWEVNDHKYLVAVHPNFETSQYTAVRTGMTFDNFGKRILSCTLGYGFLIPRFFRNPGGAKAIYSFIDSDEDTKLILENEFKKKLHAYIPYESYKHRKEKCKDFSASYCEQIYSSFYAAKTNRTTGKAEGFSKYFQKISSSERGALYKGDDFIQGYKIKKVSDDEIKVERLKV
jgi:hypothetical protein